MTLTHLDTLTTDHSSCTPHSLQTSTNVFALEAWRHNLQNETVHAPYTTCLAHVLKRTLVECRPTARTNRLSLHAEILSPPGSPRSHAVPLGAPWKFWKIFWEWFVYIHKFVVLKKCTVCFTRQFYWHRNITSEISCTIFGTIRQWRKQLLRIFGPELIRINQFKLIKTTRSAVSKNRAERDFFLRRQPRKFENMTLVGESISGGFWRYFWKLNSLQEVF